ncbi:MAG: hypothetical protein DRN88_03995 [Candidatus Hydrothermarchaeota archaeon]|nr:MAG: hypothetical protein DRN88_03995 [Candidatus Hydrothermarchaeota archaeon]
MSYVMLAIDEYDYHLFLELLKGAFKERKIEHDNKEEDALIFEEKITFEDYYVLHSILIRLV